MIIYQHRVYREDLQNNPDVLYVFGDNLLRIGMGGQAGQMRGEPNAVGVATKRGPTMQETNFFRDEDFEWNKRIIQQDTALIKYHLLRGGVVVVPSDGIGTGLSEMPIRCPKTFVYVCSLGLGGANVQSEA